jgi:hypothetical protein
VVFHITKVVTEVAFDIVLFKTTLELVQHVRQGVDGPLELDHLAGEFVDAAGHGGVAAEELVFNLIDVVFKPGHHRPVVIHHPVQQGIEDGLGPVPQKVRPAFEPLPHPCHAGRLGMPHSNHEVFAGEDMEFAELHGLRGVQVPGRPKDGEQVVFVALKLGTLVRGDGVFHGQGVQSELRGHRRHFLGSGAVEADPGHPAVVRQGLERLFQVFGLGVAHAVNVNGVINDGHGLLSFAKVVRGIRTSPR